MLILPILLFLLSSPAVAAGGGCHDLWFTRNLIMDRAGYCFGSALGQAVFDNSDCTGEDITLDDEAKRFIAEIRMLEMQHRCAIDTSATRLDLDDAFVRRRLVHLPIRDEFSSGCLGWRGSEIPLYADYSESSEVIGRVGPGDFISFDHLPVGEWTYVTVRDDRWAVKQGGWLGPGMTEHSCPNWAG